MIVGVLKEPSFESRVSLLAEAFAGLLKKGVQVWVETGSGLKAFCPDEEYIAQGGIIKSRQEIFSQADVLLSIHSDEIPASLKNKVLIGIFQPLYQQNLMKSWAAQQITSFSLDMLPRNTRAQSMDVLSSQANIAGYKAVLLAANQYPKYFPMFMTAAGSIPPTSFAIAPAER